MSISWRILIKYMAILLRSRFNEYKVFYSTPMTVVNEHIKKLFVWGAGYHRSFLSWFFHGKLTNCINVVNKNNYWILWDLEIFWIFFFRITPHPLHLRAFHPIVKFIGYYFYQYCCTSGKNAYLRMLLWK